MAEIIHEQLNNNPKPEHGRELSLQPHSVKVIFEPTNLVISVWNMSFKKLNFDSKCYSYFDVTILSSTAVEVLLLERADSTGSENTIVYRYFTCPRVEHSV